MSKPEYTRPQAEELSRRLEEPRRFLQVITGARQVGKTTLVTQVAEGSDLPSRFASADEPTLRGSEWIEQQWALARVRSPAVGRGVLPPVFLQLRLYPFVIVPLVTLLTRRLCGAAPSFPGHRSR